MLTLRKKIAEALEGQCLDLRELSKLFGIKEREALDHLKHIAKSVHPRRLTAEPASCRQYKEAWGADLGYWDLVSSIKKVALSICMAHGAEGIV
jgi:predicted Zn-ribbon and HTH transcriptional regulator